MAGIAVLAPSAKAMAADHYVLASATGAGTGADWTDAYTCIPADAALVRGDTYWIGPGDYREICDGAAPRTFNKAVSNGLVITFRRAIAANHGPAGDWNASFGTGQAIFHPLRFESSDWTLDGQTRTDYRTGYLLRVTSVKPDGVTSYNSAGSRFVVGTGCSTCGSGGTSSSNDTIQYVQIDGTRDLGANLVNTENGIYLYSNGSNVSTNISVNHNSITKPGNSNIDAYAINLTVEYNWLAYNWSTSSSHAEGIAAKGSFSNLTIRYNIFEDIFGTADIATPNSGGTATPNGMYIYGNSFFRSIDNPENASGLGNGTIAILSCTAVTNLYAYNNTIVNMNSANSGSPRLLSVSPQTNTTSPCYPDGGSVVNFTAENNLWYNNSNVDNSNTSCGTCTGTYVWDHNAYFDTAATSDTDPNKQSGSGSPFVNYSAKDFRLAFATAAGATLASPFNTDTGGATRGADGVWDRGAYEFTSGSPPPPPDTTPPSVPTGLATAAESTTQINLSWTASTDNVGVTGYKIYRGGVQIGTSASVGYSDTGLTASTTYSYAIAAYDAAGNVSAQSASVSATTQSTPAPAPAPAPDTTPPTVSLTAPVNGATVSSTIAVTATASDNVGVAKVEFYLDNVLQAAGTTSPYTWSWDTTAAANASHILSAKAYDAAGNIGTSGNVTVTVSNASKTGSSTTTTATTTTTTPPSTSFQILSIGVSQVTDTSAVITLTTNQPASVVLNYGPTTNYGQTLAASPYLTTIYENLTGLTPNTVYDFQVAATPEGTNTQVTSPNYVFATQPAPSPTPPSSGSGGAGSGSSGGGAYVPPPISGSESSSGGALGAGSSSGILLPAFPRNLMLEDTGSDVTLLQTLLKSMDYFPPTFAPTTYFGLLTQHALLLFQRDHQLNRSGFLDLQSQVLLNKVAEAQGIGGSAGTETSGTPVANQQPPISSTTSNTNSASFTRYLTVGSRGQDVTLLQQLLIKDNDYPEGIVSGYFGLLTQAAVRRFQAKYGIVSSGTPATTGYGAVGPRTRGRMNAQ